MAIAAPAPDPATLAVIADTGDASAGDGADLYLEVVLNGNPATRIAHFRQSGARLRASAATLRALGLRLPPGVDPVDLGDLAGVSFHYDEGRQRVAIRAPAALLDLPIEVLNAHEAAIPQPQASPGALLNYDVYGTRDDGGAVGLAASTELRAFNAWGVLSNSAITRATQDAGWSAATVRLDTTFSRSFVDGATTLRLGDMTSGNLAWTRATRLGGVQWQRNFALQPDLITFPVPAFYGQAALPSTVDLYIDGLRRYSGQVPAGPFRLDTVPVVNGNGQAQVVVTDALGRQNSLAFAFYTTNQLLRRGLSDYSLEAGFVRRGYGAESFAYGHDAVASGSYRRGATDWLTLEGHAEGGAGLANAGIGAVVAFDGLGVVNAAAAGSHHAGHGGSLAQLGYSWRNERFNVSLDSTRSFGRYRDVAALDGQPPARRSDRVVAGATLGRAGSLGLSYVALQYPGESRSRYASAFYFRSLGNRASLNLSVNQNLDERADRSLFVGLSLALDHGTSAGLSLQHDARGNLVALDASRPLDPDGGSGWRTRVQDGSQGRGGQAEAGWRGQQGEVLAGVQAAGGHSQVYADAGGALVFMGGQFFAARRINDAFAVVSTDGVAGVPVLLENRPIGTTNARGALLVTPLNAYQRNQLAIDPMQLPADLRIERVDAEVVPSDRAGTLVRFGMQPVAAASIILHDAGGHPLPVGSRVQLQGQPASNGVVGYDGIVYLEGLGARNVLDVQTTAGRCLAQFDYPSGRQTVPVIGPLACRKETP
ncbi:MAG: fimbrial biogenesis outer membrane usher protein [Rhodanobacteraceae bacterium]|nr:fimbrial biogenesis outer membrane usher protein [Rhodanobacteraceae bacterium]